MQSTYNNFFSGALGFLIDGLCVPTTASTDMKMNDREEPSCDDDNSVTAFRFDLPVKHHYMCERDDRSCYLRESPRRSSPPISPTNSYDATQVTAALTSKSSFDINDALSTETNCEFNRIFRSDETSCVNSIFRPTQDYDFERREQHTNLVRMKQANYQLEETAPRPSRPRRALTSTLNRRPASPKQLKYEYPDKQMKQVAHTQCLRQRPEQPQQHSVMGRAA